VNEKIEWINEWKNKKKKNVEKINWICEWKNANFNKKIIKKINIKVN